MFRSLSQRLFALLMVALFVGARITPAVAAPGDLLFEDDFTTLDPAFGEATETLLVENNELVNTLDPNQWSRRLYQSMLFDDVDATVRVQFQLTAADHDAGSGLMFWAASADDAYILEIGPHGTFSVQHFLGGRYYAAYPFRKSDAINTEPGAYNELRVVTVGNHATMYINGQEVASIEGRAPEGGSLVGLYAETFNQAAAFRFAGMKIVEPAPSRSSGIEADPGVIFADNFATLAMRWNAAQEWLRIEDGRLVVDYEPNHTHSMLNAAELVEGDVDASMTVTVRSEAGDESTANAALSFWGLDSTSYYILAVYGNGNVAVHRYVNNRWLTPLPAQPAPEAAHVDATAGVELRVVTNGRKATLYVNGVEFATIAGQPPQDFSLVGLYGQAGETASTSTFDDFVARRPEVN